MKQFIQFSVGFVYFHFVEIHWVLFHFSTYAKRKVTQYLLILTLYQLIMSKKKTKQCSNERKEGRKDQKKTTNLYWINLRDLEFISLKYL